LRRILAASTASVVAGAALLVVAATGAQSSPVHRLPAGPSHVDRVAALSTDEPTGFSKRSQNADVITSPVSTPAPRPVHASPPKSLPRANVKPVVVAHAAAGNSGDQQGEHQDGEQDGATVSGTAPSGSAKATAQATPVVAAPAGSGLSLSGVWACIMRLESGGNPRAVNPSSGAGGLFQFLPSTWASLGGTGRPQDASPALQFAMAQKLQARSGWSQWVTHGACGV
jgi:hypothetical protein